MENIITQDDALLGVVTLDEYKAQRAIILGLSDKMLSSSKQLLEAARKQLTSVWYSQSQAKYLLMTARQVSPYNTDLHKWLEEVLRSRTTTAGLVFERTENVEK
jgi:enoyl-CoA hydratase/carnithine racemase